MELIFKKYFKAIFIKTIKVRRIKHCSYYSQVWKTTQKLKQQTQARNALLLFLPIQVSKSHKWFSEVEGIECSVITLLGGTSSLWWLVLWVVSSHQEICDGCSLLPFRSKLDLKTRQLCPSWNPKSVLLDLEFSSFAGENMQNIIISRTLYTASWKLEMTLRLVKLDRMIHLLLALFQSLSSFKEIFVSQWSPPLSSFLLLSSKHLLCFMLGGRMKGCGAIYALLPVSHFNIIAA